MLPSLNPFFFFSSGGTSLQGKQTVSEQLSSSIPVPVPFPVPVSIYHFDGSSNSGKGEKKLQVYTQKRKQGQKEDLNLTSHEPLQESTLEPTELANDLPLPSSPLPAQISDSLDLDQPIALRKGVRICTKHPMFNFVSYHTLSPSFHNFYIVLSSIYVPHSVSKVIIHPKWRDVMDEEIKALKMNKTWELVDHPREKMLVGWKWVFRVKYKFHGTLDKYKARLVAKRYTQTFGIDYQETFALVAKMNSIRVLISLPANQEEHLLQFDVKKLLFTWGFKGRGIHDSTTWIFHAAEC